MCSSMSDRSCRLVLSTEDSLVGISYNLSLETQAMLTYRPVDISPQNRVRDTVGIKKMFPYRTRTMDVRPIVLARTHTVLQIRVVRVYE